MLRRWIPLFGMAALLLLLAAEPASAGLRDRLANRRGNSYAPVYYSQATPTATITTTGSFVATEEPGYTGTTGRRFGRRGAVYSSGPVYYPATTAGATPGQVPGAERTAFYPSGPSNNTVLLNVRLPADAELRIEGQRMMPTGPARQFFSPILDPSREYTYQLQAKWMENGREVSRTRTLTFKPGRQLEIDFLTRMPDEKPTP